MDEIKNLGESKNYLFDSNMIKLNCNINVLDSKIEQKVDDSSFNHNDFNYTGTVATQFNSERNSIYTQDMQNTRAINRKNSENLTKKILEKKLEIDEIFKRKNLNEKISTNNSTTNQQIKSNIDNESRRFLNNMKRQSKNTSKKIETNTNEKPGFMKKFFGFLGCTSTRNSVKDTVIVDRYIQDKKLENTRKR